MAGKSTYDRDKAMDICVEISCTEDSFKKICERVGVNYRTAWRWVADVPEFKEMYVLAQQQRTFLQGDTLVEIADEECKNLVDVGRQKNRMQARMFIMGKHNMKVYGDNKTLTAEIKTPQQMTPEQFNMLLEATLNRPKMIDQETEDIGHEEL